MKRTLIAAMMAGMMFAATTAPAMAMVGVEKPTDPDMMVITTISAPAEGENGASEQESLKQNRVLLAKDTPEGDKIWYTNPVEVTTLARHAVKGYVVQQGDSLWKIVSKSLKTKNAGDIARGVATVAEINNLTDPDVLFVGQDLTIPYELSK